MLLWTTRGEPDECAEIRSLLDEIGMERTAITVIPTEDTDPLARDGWAGA